MEPRFTLTLPSVAAVPLVVSVPHAGTHVPSSFAARLLPAARALPDTDWHVDDLVRFVPDLGGVLLCARASRLVVDLNRPRDGAPLYPGRAETSVVPTTLFSGEPVWDGPVDDVEARLVGWWDPYHATLRDTVQQLHARFGRVLLVDVHSIASVVPRFFTGTLPGLVLGTADGASAGPAVVAAARRVLSDHPEGFSENQPFKGGYITRHYGRPSDGVHALQLEMAQRLYMIEGPPFSPDPVLADRLRSTLSAFVTAALRAVLEHG